MDHLWFIKKERNILLYYAEKVFFYSNLFMCKIHVLHRLEKISIDPLKNIKNDLFQWSTAQVKSIPAHGGGITSLSWASAASPVVLATGGALSGAEMH